MILPITLTIAAAATLLNLWIAQRVGKARLAQRVFIGDGGSAPLVARMRAHANYVEYTPFFLILLGLIELARGSEKWLWAVAVAYIIGRIAHAFGMDRPLPDRLRLRMIGTVVTMVVLLGLSLYAIWIATTERPRAPSITYAAARPV
jgi:uncharacterized protein